MNPIPYTTLQTTLDPRGVLTVALNRPDVRNAFNPTVIGELARAFGVDAHDPKVRAVVLRGQGSVFCAGGDLNWMKSAANVGFDENLADTQALSRMFALINECPKPVIGAVQGAAIGGGVGLVSVCDMVVAAKDTQFSLSEVRLGIVPACIGPFVIAKIGASHARKLFMSAERFKADVAHHVGLVHEVVNGAADLDAAVERLLANILACGPNALSVVKKLVLDLSWPERRAELREGALDHVARVLAEVRISPEGQEGVKAFLEKRPPNWIGGK